MYPNDRKNFRVRNLPSYVLLLINVILFLNINNVSAEESKKSSIQTGSGIKYKTEVNRITKGEISKKDLHQVSLLTSRVMSHIEKGVYDLADNNSKTAKNNVDKALALIRIVREILPVTIVKTEVKDKDGNVVYEHSESIQDDMIQLFSNMIELEVVEPLVEAKENEAALKGLRFRDANIIYSTVLADLTYIERKLKSASLKLDNPKESLKELLFAQTKGVELKVNEQDNPLIDVQKALKLAERMVEENRLEAAKYNLSIANIQLETYKNTLGTQEGKKVNKLQQEIEKVKTKLQAKDAAGNIREFWQRAVSWFKPYPGQAKDTSKSENDE